MANCKVFAIANQKGGVGKTTTVLNVGIGLSQLGKKVLLIDADPQGDLTTCMGYDENDFDKTISTLMKSSISKQPLDFENTILHHKENVDLIPSNLELSEVALSLVNVTFRENKMKHWVEQLREQYDYILIDCQPSLEMMPINALACADKVIIPVQAQFLAAKDTSSLLRTIHNVKDEINPSLDIESILLTMVDKRTTLSAEIRYAIQESYGSHVKISNIQIPQAIKVARSSSQGKSIFAYDKNNKVAEAYLQFAKEIDENGKERKQNSPSRCR